MIERTWLDLADPSPRRLLVVVTLVSLVVGTLLLERLHLSVLQVDLVSLGWLGGLALLWGLLRWRTEPRVRARRMGEEARREQAMHHRSLMVGGAIEDGRGGMDALVLRDPAFSEAALADRVRRLLEAQWSGDPRASAWIRCEVPDAFHLVDVRFVSVTHRADRVRSSWSVHGPGRDGADVTLRLVLERPTAATSPSPDELSTLDGSASHDDWYLIRAERGQQEALPLPSESDELDSQLRALVGRDPDFDAEALRERARGAVEGLHDPDPSTLQALCTAAMSDAAVGLHGHLADGLPPQPLLEHVHLVAVGSDGWYDLAELTCGPLALAFLRPCGESEAPWLLWRAWRGSSP